MAYVKTDWENLPSTDTPITETALDNMENGIEYNDQRLNGTKPMGSIVVDDVSCKNMLPRKGSITINGITITEQSDGSLILNGTATNNVSYYYCGDDTTYLPFSGLEQGGTFTLSSTSANGYTIYILKSGGTVITSLSNGGSTTFTTSANETYRIFIRVNNGTTLNNIHIYPQLEIGDTATPYTPHKTFENLEVYSFGERKIGIWDDGKDLYEQTIIATPNISSETASSSFTIPIANVDQVFIRDMTKIADTSTSGYVYGFPFLAGSISIGGYISVGTSNLTFNVRKTTNVGFYSIKLVLAYTKTSSSSRSIQSEEE